MGAQPDKPIHTAKDASEFQVNPISPFDRALLEKLRSLRSTFVDMRNKMGVSEQVGLASLPLCHDSNLSLAVVTHFGGDDTPSTYFYGKAVFIFAVNEKLSASENDRLIVMPDLTQGIYPPTANTTEPAPGAVVSIYDPMHLEQNGIPSIPDKVIIGLMAHELAETRIKCSGIPENMNNTIDRRNTEIDQTRRRDIHDPRDEAKFNIVASLFGYRKERIAAFDYSINRLKTLQLKWTHLSIQ